VATIPTTSSAAQLRTEADALLRRNDTGSWIVAAPDLYPHQWDWDAGFIAVGWAHLDLDRAVRELQSLLAAQWSNGKIPHIVFDRDAPADSYWPGPQHWACKVPDEAPSGCTPGTSGWCQPPVHAIGVERLWRIAARAGDGTADRARSFLATAFPQLMAWHAYLLTARDPEGCGLVSLSHPWESGMDNASCWDAPMAAITARAARAARTADRPDLRVLNDGTQRPRDLAYDRFHLLVARLRDVCYDDAMVHAGHPFMVKDVFAGHPRLRWAVPPSTSPFDAAFDARRYWRGPSWPVMTWLLWWALRRAGQPAAAESLRAAGLEQIWCSGGFPEYVESFSGEPLGSLRQSWTAAVTIDWLAGGTTPWNPAVARARHGGLCARAVHPTPGDRVESGG
jgi:hypothetical protein